jgi:hypothetical protein
MRKENRYCGNQRCKSTKPHAVTGGAYTCEACGSVKRLATCLQDPAWTPSPVMAVAVKR